MESIIEGYREYQSVIRSYMTKVVIATQPSCLECFAQIKLARKAENENQYIG